MSPHHHQMRHPQGESDSIEELVLGRLKVIAAPAKAQVEEARSAQGLVCHDNILRANVAQRAAFNAPTLVCKLSTAEPRKQ